MILTPRQSTTTHSSNFMANMDFQSFLPAPFPNRTVTCSTANFATLVIHLPKDYL